MVNPTKSNALKCLNRALDDASQVKGLGHNSSIFQKWKTSTIQDLKRIFGNSSDHPNDFDRSLIVHLHEDAGTNVIRAISLLRSWAEEIEEDWTTELQSTRVSHINHEVIPRSNRVFVVHGHDETIREKVAGFLRKLDLEPIVLHEQPNIGRTIIEKFVDYADVGFAVILLTPDDVGAVKNKENDLKPRARQNVIFELGYFVGILGRNKVCALKEKNVETPSDYDGVVYTDLDAAGAWKMEVVRELKGAGFEIDANRLIKP